MSKKKTPRKRTPARASAAPDASVRQLEAEGADAPAPRARKRPRAHTAEKTDEMPTFDATVEAAPAEDVAARIRELEARIDEMMRASPHPSPAATGPRPSPPPVSGEGDQQPITTSSPSGRGELASDFYARRYGRLGMRGRAEDSDEFGHDPAYERKVLPLFDFLYDKYFRVEVRGIDNVPPDGRCLLVANHSGTLPLDGMMLRLAVRREHPKHRDVRWLAEDVIFHFPFLGTFTNRVGAVRACQENGARLLDAGALVAVFPEGLKGIGKLYRDRYKLQRFGRGGFVKLCLRTRAPIVPVAIVGGEETNPLLARVEYLARAAGIPYLPVTPTFPLLGPLGLLPAPTKWKIRFGEPIDFEEHAAEAANDEILVGKLTERVRGVIQQMLDQSIAERRSIWFG